MPRWSYETRVARPVELASDPPAAALHRRISRPGDFTVSSLRTGTLKELTSLIQHYHKEATTPSHNPRHDHGELCGGGGGWGHERRQGEMMEGVVRVEMDGKGGVSYGRGCVRVCGAGSAGEKRSGGRRRGGGRAAGPPRPTACALRKMIPAHASEPRGVSEGRVAAKAAAVAAKAAASVQPLGRRSTRR